MPVTADRHPGKAGGVRLLVCFLALVLAGSGYVLGVQLSSPDVSYDRVPPPQPTETGLPASIPRAAVPGVSALGSSAPVSIDIPSLGIHADVLALGLNPDGTVAVPAESQATEASWYDGSASPGQDGAAVILGHVDSFDLPRGRAAFYALGAAKKGDQVDVTRADGQVAVFTVDVATLIAKNDFPTGAVYGPTAGPELRLITCGGSYTTATGYAGNVIVFAHYVGSHAAG